MLITSLRNPPQSSAIQNSSSTNSSRKFTGKVFFFCHLRIVTLVQMLMALTRNSVEVEAPSIKIML